MYVVDFEDHGQYRTYWCYIDGKRFTYTIKGRDFEVPKRAFEYRIQNITGTKELCVLRDTI